MARSPLPKIFEGHSIATDWKTGQVYQDLVYRNGQYWDPFKWETDSDGKWQHRDLARRRKQRAFTSYLNSQPATTGL